MLGDCLCPRAARGRVLRSPMDGVGGFVAWKSAVAPIMHRRTADVRQRIKIGNGCSNAFARGLCAMGSPPWFLYSYYVRT